MELFDIQRAAATLAISPWTVRAYIRAGKLEPVRIGRRVLLEETELERFVKEAKTNKHITHTSIELDSSNNKKLTI